MEKANTIKDVRYFESDWLNLDGSPLPQHVGKLFKLSPEITIVGVRLVRKLREYNFILGSFDHVYINFTNILDNYTIKESSRTNERWFKYYDFGVSPDIVNTMSDTEKYNFILESTLAVLKLINSNSENLSKIVQAVNEIKEYGDKLEIKCATKDTKYYFVEVTHDIQPFGKNSNAYISVLNKKSNQRLRKKMIDLKSWEDVYPLVGNITLSADQIIIKPKATENAKFYIQNYETPIVIDLDQFR